HLRRLMALARRAFQPRETQGAEIDARILRRRAHDELGIFVPIAGQHDLRRALDRGRPDIGDCGTAYSRERDAGGQDRRYDTHGTSPRKRSPKGRIARERWRDKGARYSAAFAARPAPRAMRSSAIRSAMTFVGWRSASARLKIAPSVSAMPSARRS